MTVIKHSPLSRGIAVTLLLLLLLALYMLLFVPLQQRYHDNQQELDYLARQLAVYERVANSREEIEKLFQSVRQDDEALGYYLKGSTKALASAELQAYVSTIIEASDGSLVSTQPIVKDERVPERMVKVSVRMNGTIDSLVKVLFRIANGVPVLTTDEVLIRRNKAAQSRARSTESADALEIQFMLTGFVNDSVL
jgi:hypothetical protein